MSPKVALLLTLGALVMSSCTTSTTKKELELTSVHPADDHRKIATYYSQEAVRLRQVSEDLTVRIDVYERLFGDTSDWVSGTRLLGQSYQEAAKEFERKANIHLELIPESRPPSVPRSGVQ
jgi:hypothetical protein